MTHTPDTCQVRHLTDGETRLDVALAKVDVIRRELADAALRYREAQRAIFDLATDWLHNRRERLDADGVIIERVPAGDVVGTLAWSAGEIASHADWREVLGGLGGSDPEVRRRARASAAEFDRAVAEALREHLDLLPGQASVIEDMLRRTRGTASDG